MTIRMQNVVTCDACFKEEVVEAEVSATGWRIIQVQNLRGGSTKSGNVCSGSCAIIFVDHAIPAPS